MGDDVTRSRSIAVSTELRLLVVLKTYKSKDADSGNSLLQGASHSQCTQLEGTVPLAANLRSITSQLYG